MLKRRCLVEQLETRNLLTASEDTGLHQLVEIILEDPGLERNASTTDIAEGAASAQAMNQIIVDGVIATGIGNDGAINAADVHDLNAFIRAEHLDAWISLHGDDEDGEETGFHLVQNDGATSRLFNAQNAVNTVADGIYHLGFQIVNGRLLNEDGAKNASVATVANWLNELLRDDLAGNALKNPDVEAYAQGTTGTGLDRIVNAIAADPGLNYRISTSDITGGARAANSMNEIIVAAVQSTGLANDGQLSTSDVYDLNRHIRENHLEQWIELHGDDEDGEETGFHLVQNDGANSRIFEGYNTVNTVADGIYHLGFQVVQGRFLNEDGDKNASVETVAYWLSELLRDDLANDSLVNVSVNPYAEATTNTGLDRLVDTIAADPGLNHRIATSEITDGAMAADAMNQIVVDAIIATGIANNGEINAADVYNLNAYIRANHLAEWIELHGDDENGEETGFHLVQNDGARTLMFNGQNAVNTVADGIYHLGFQIVKGRLLNEDGDKNASVQTVANWLNELLREDLAGEALKNPAVNAYAEGTTGTGLDSIVAMIAADPGLNYRISTTDITDGARAADGMNQLLVEAIVQTGVANDGELDKFDLYDVNAYLRANHLPLWTELHGDDEDGEETGFHLVQNDGASTRIFGGRNAVNTIADGIYHAGFDISKGRFLNEDGAKNASVESVAFWLDTLLEDDLASGALANPALAANADEIAAAEVYSLEQLELNEPGDHLEVTHSSDLELNNGTYVVTFQADDVDTRTTLFSKDARGYADGGHLTAFVRDGFVEVRLQTADRSAYLRSTSLVRDGETHHVAVSFGEDGFRLYLDGQLEDIERDFTSGMSANKETLAIGTNIWARDARNPTWSANHFRGELNDFAVYNRALTGTEIHSLGSDVATPRGNQGATGTGLDKLVNLIHHDLGLYNRIAAAEIAAGAAAADAMNAIIVEAISETGVANNGKINGADVRQLNTYIRANHYEAWVTLHGDDEGGAETGFHLVQNDGARERIFGGYNAINSVADGIYHLGFEIERGRLLNEDGDRNASVQSVAFWLDELLSDQLKSGELVNEGVDAYPTPTSGTGLDSLVRIIAADPGLNRNIASGELTEGATAADEMNGIIVDAIVATGIANDEEISAADVYDINAYIRANHLERWIELHGDDEDGEETGFHLVQNDGATSRLFNGINAVNTVADGLYHLGFEIDRGRLLNEDGNKNASVHSVAYWLDSLLQDDLNGDGLKNPDVDADANGSTGVGLDTIVNVIASDPGLNARIATADITAGARAADAMNAIIVEAIRKTGVANDGVINAADVYDLNAYIRDQHLERWIELHGDDEDGEETGFHLVQNDGASSRMFGGRNAVNTIADGIYHLGFEIDRGRLLNEDGAKNASVQSVAHWLNSLLHEDLAGDSLKNPDVAPYASPTTGTGLDDIVDLIAADPGLNRNISTSDITEGAAAADKMNQIVVDAIIATGVANNGNINAADIRDVNAYIRANHLAEWIELHGDDEDGEETGFHLVQNDGATSRLFNGQNAVNTVADGIYHLGFQIVNGRFLNEDGDKNASVQTVAYWLDSLLHEDLAGEALKNPAVNAYAEGTTGTGLDSIVAMIAADPGLNYRISTTDITDGARAADGMNQLLVEAIVQTGVANDGELDKFDLYDVNAYLRANHLPLWTELHGDDEDGEETGFHLVQNDGASTRIFGGRNAVNTIADGIYHAGFDISKGRFLNEDGAKNASVESVAFWLDTLLEDDLASGALANPALAANADEIAAAEVYSLEQLELNEPGDHLEVTHSSDLELNNGTYVVTFQADDVDTRTTLFSKDARGYADGGHLTAFVRDGFVEVRLQTADRSAYLRSTSLVRDGETHHVAVSFGEDGFRLYLDGQLEDIERDFTSGMSANKETLAIGTNIWARDARNPTWSANHFRGELNDFAVYNRALTGTEIHSLGSDVATPRGNQGATGTGLDKLVNLIHHDLGLYNRIDAAEIAAGAAAADAMNVIIVEAISETGVAADGRISAADVRDLNAYIRANHYEAWVTLHGDDEGGAETGFHVVQNDGARERIFGGYNAVNSVADGIYHLGFEIERGRLLNEDGDRNASIESVAFWLDELLFG